MKAILCMLGAALLGTALPADAQGQRPVVIEARGEVLGPYAPEQHVPKHQWDEPTTNWLVPIRKVMDQHGYVELTHRRVYTISPTRQEQYIVVRNHSRVKGNGATIRLDPNASLWPHTDRGWVFGTVPEQKAVNVWIDDVRFDLSGAENPHDVTLRGISITGHQIRVTRCHFRGFRAGTKAECFVVWLPPSWNRAWTEVSNCSYEDAAPNRALWEAKFPDGIPTGTWIPELSLSCATIIKDNKSWVIQDENQVSGIHHIVPVGGFGCLWESNVCRYQGRSRMVWIQRPGDGHWTEMVDGGGNMHIRIP